MVKESYVEDNMRFLLDTVKCGDDGKFIFDEDAKAVIKEIAKYSVNTKLFNENNSLLDDFWKKFSPLNADGVYRHLISVIASAPSVYHERGAVILLMPKIDELIDKGCL